MLFVFFHFPISIGRTKRHSENIIKCLAEFRFPIYFLLNLLYILITETWSTSNSIIPISSSTSFMISKFSKLKFVSEAIIHLNETLKPLFYS